MPAQRSWGPPPPQHPVSEGLVDVGGVRLWCWDTGGSGEPIVLLHPATGSGAIWEYQQPVFAAAGYRVIGYSRRGHYRSETGPTDNIGNAVDDLDRLMDALKIERFHIVGSAWGGFIVPDYALAHPERLLSMTIACSQGGVSEPSYRQLIDAITPQPFRNMPASLRELGPAYRAANPAGVARWEELEHVAQSSERPLRQPTKNRLLWPDVERIRTPALLFTGGADLYAPPPLMLEYARHLQGAETAILSESGHSGYWEQPDAFNELVLDFVRRHSESHELERRRGLRQGSVPSARY
jgi:pimeloyl-ACP methyl ester carboxylesterase